MRMKRGAARSISRGGGGKLRCWWRARGILAPVPVGSCSPSVVVPRGAGEEARVADFARADGQSRGQVARGEAFRGAGHLHLVVHSVPRGEEGRLDEHCILGPGNLNWSIT